MPHVQVSYSRVKLGLIALGSIGLCIAALWIILDVGEDTADVVIGWSGLLLFGSAATFAVKRLFTTRPVLVIDDAGLTDTSGPMSVGFVPWLDVEDVKVGSYRGQRYIAVYVQNENQYYTRGGVFSRLLRRANGKATGTPVTLITGHLAISVDELHEQILYYAQPYLKTD